MVTGHTEHCPTHLPVQEINLEACVPSVLTQIFGQTRVMNPSHSGNC